MSQLHAQTVRFHVLVLSSGADVAKHFSGMQNGTKFAKTQENSKFVWPGPIMQRSQTWS